MITITINTLESPFNILVDSANTSIDPNHIVFPEVTAPYKDIAAFADEVITHETDQKVTTASELFLLRVRRRVAEGKLSPDQVVIDLSKYDINESVTLDADGNLSQWVDGLFSEGYQEVRAMRRAVALKKKIAR